MNSPWLKYWRLSTVLAISWSLLWFIFLNPSQYVQPMVQVFWLVTPWAWLHWWARNGHYKPIFLAQLLTILFAVFSMSYLVGNQYIYALIAVLLWFILFYVGFKHLKIIKQTLTQQFDAK